jgi:hypothetical protein
MDHATSVRALADVDRDHASFDRTSGCLQLLPLTNERARGNRFERPHPTKDRERVRSDDPVWVVPDVPLEESERGIGPRTVQSVLLPAVEAESIQHPLELPDIVSSEHRGPVIQGAIAELPSGLDELFPRVGPDEAVDLEMSVPLEPSDGCLRRGAERTVTLGVVDDGSERRQPRLDIRDLRTSVAQTIDAHRSESAWARGATATAVVAAP